MLVYLDALIDALRVRDAVEAGRLLAHPLARLLPEEVRLEAQAFTTGVVDGLAAPMRALQLRYQTAELLRDASAADAPALAWDDAFSPSPTASSRRHQQMELPLSA